MKSVVIQSNEEGVGRIINPYINCDGQHRPAPCCSDCECDFWDKFEAAVKYYTVYDLNGNVLANYRGIADEQPQVYDAELDIWVDATAEFKTRLSRTIFRVYDPHFQMVKNKDYWRGFKNALDALEDLGYCKTSLHPYNIRDCVLAKYNQIPKEEIRKNDSDESFKKIINGKDAEIAELKSKLNYVISEIRSVTKKIKH